MQYIVRMNNAYIGTMVLTAAQILGAHYCRKVGDVVTVTTDDESDSYYISDAPFEIHTFYHNGAELLCFSHTETYQPTFTSEEEIQQKLRTKTYTNRLTGFKYNRDYYRFMGKSATDMKRDINRAARRVGKELTREQIAA
jgi:hypothetical protein